MYVVDFQNGELDSLVAAESGNLTGSARSRCEFFIPKEVFF